MYRCTIACFAPRIDSKVRSIRWSRALGQHLDHDVVRDQVALDELADEVEVGLARPTGSRPRSPCSPSAPAARTSAACARGSSGRSAPGCRRAGRRRTSAAPRSIRLVGQVRSGSSTLNCWWKGRYLWIGMPEGCWAFAAHRRLTRGSRLVPLAGDLRPARRNLRDERTGRQWASSRQRSRSTTSTPSPYTAGAAGPGSHSTVAGLSPNRPGRAGLRTRAGAAASGRAASPWPP